MPASLGGSLLPLVERDDELGALRDALAAAAAGNGTEVVIHGPPGIGKSALLRAAGELARAAGQLTLAAAGTDPEREFPYGAVRRMLEGTVRGAPDSRRAELLSGPAAAAGSAVLGLPVEQPLPEPAFAIMHGLYWLVAGLAARQPLALILDDAQWADESSLRFLGYLARRLDGLPVTVITAARANEGESGQELFAALLDTPGARELRPAPLSEVGVAALLSRALGRAAPHAVTKACRDVTGGNPFLVNEVLPGLAELAAAPAAAVIERITAAPPRVIRATRERLGRLPPEAAALGRAIAVLGADATLPRAGAVAGLSEPETLAALDELAAADLITVDGGVAFRHPILRSAVYDELPPGTRSGAHRRAARRLRDEGAAPDAVAGHLLRSEPTGDLAAVAMLRQAATSAAELGAPESAVRYLERALAEEPGRPLRAEILLELAAAEKLARQPGAARRYAEAARLASDPVVRARANTEQAQLHLYAGAVDEARRLIDAALAELEHRDELPAVEAVTLRASHEAYIPSLTSRFNKSLPQLDALVDARAPGSRPLAMLLAGVAAQRDEPTERVVMLAEQGWDDGRYLADGESVELLPQGIGALLMIDRLDRAGEMIEATQAAAAASGSVMHYLVAAGHAALLHQRRGDLTMAAAQLRATVDHATQSGQQYAVVVSIGYCRDVLIERPDLADIAATVEAIDFGQLGETLAGAMFLATRGSLRFSSGRQTTAIADLRAAVDFSAALQMPNAIGAAWRSDLALVLGRAHPAEAIELAEAELAAARRVARARRIGIALRTLGIIHPDRGAGRARLEESEAVLAGSPARLEQARTLLELGANLRRSGLLAEARQRLRGALDLAAQCGATRLAERGRAELVAAGARPRRVRLSGRDALTPAELRVALLAAEGRTSREIAQTLFVTTKTVDTHLNRAYAKLGISSRGQLAYALSARARGEAGTRV